jgi:hypothetical protein
MWIVTVFSENLFGKVEATTRKPGERAPRKFQGRPERPGTRRGEMRVGCAVRGAAALAVFPHRRLHGVHSGGMQEMLWSQQGINCNDYPDGCKRGRVVVRAAGEREVTFTHKRTQAEATVTALRSWWETRPAPHFTPDAGGFLAGVIPALPELDAAA